MPTNLTAKQKDQICAILAVGCDRETAAGVVECSVVDIGRAIANAPPFAIQVRRAEATAEWRHMQNILNATKDGKYWRASVWWLERRSPERFARRPAGAITPRQLQQAAAAWIDLLQQQFPSLDDQQRIAACFTHINASIEAILDARCAATVRKRRPTQRRLGHTPDATAADDAANKSNSTREPAQP